jgi:uncharacterized membrane protein YpjA
MVYIMQLLRQQWVLWTLLVINVLGTIYGYIWYRFQLEITPTQFLPFVPDSPTASLFFVIVLIGFLQKKNYPLIEALAIITLFKYGIWAVGMNLGGWYVSNTISWESMMLIGSHLAMAVQGLLYASYYRYKWGHIMIAAIWTLHNDVIDYVYGMVPRYPKLFDYIPHIGYMTFWLSLLSIYLAYEFGIRRKRNTL